ncbi:MAG: undecaprenyl-diphosphate phosphatase [Patescibacteria group bacterium]|nr:undecaprenyl-diphosphate phosphatase [Patescibacteria group bacterium]
MKITQAFLLGVIQGIAEFLPISSSGHLVLLQNWLQIYPVPFLFDIILHFSTSLAVIYFFRKRILNLNKDEIIKLGIGSIPIFVIGYLFEDKISDLFALELAAGVGLLVTSIFNFIAANKFAKNIKSEQKKMSSKDALIIGLWQTVALIPGISRSGSTLTGAALIKQRKKKAFEFSFLLSIPAILAANFYQLITAESSSLNNLVEPYFIIGIIAAFVTGVASLKILEKVIKSKKYVFFAWYCLFLGSFVILKQVF